MRAFLGFTGYYRRFIQNYSKIARPLNDLLVGQCTNKKVKKTKGKFKKSVFEWKESQQKAFDILKDKLINAPILAYADYSLPFVLHTDASITGLGAVLYQHQDEEGRVVAYASRSLKLSERNYPAHKLEFLALKWASTEKYHDYLYGAKFDVVTDNNPLTYVLTTAKLDATGQRWLAELSNYNCSISYRSGKRNGDADGLSRIPDKENSRTTTIFPDVLKAISFNLNVEEIPIVETIIDPEDEEMVGGTDEEVTAEELSGTALSSHDWQKAQADDQNINYIIDKLIAGQKPKNIRNGKRYH